jgi:hypothetical protein
MSYNGSEESVWISLSYVECRGQFVGRSNRHRRSVAHNFLSTVYGAHAWLKLVTLMGNSRLDEGSSHA